MDYLFTSSRLGFRTWRDEDRGPFAALNADQKVMKFFPETLSTQASNAQYDQIQSHFEQNHFGLYAVDSLEKAQFIGFIGFQWTQFKAHFTPSIEIAWRLVADFWDKGLATEGATACIQHGFSTLGFSEIHSFTACVNKPSERVMQKIGMTKKGEFDHPLLSKESPLKRHVHYLLSSTPI